ncbi:MAG: bifunctional glutamate N-acetyltransferase/amino-acid acetyltransferase ArgJ [Candidatus Margulisiibacteriota bacterium]
MQITDINGVFSDGISAGIKANGRLDLAYIYLPNCTGSAIVCSQNLIRSVTLVHNERVFQENVVKLLIVNSGNANSVTGNIGAIHVEQTVKAAAEKFGCSEQEVGVASTGIIGVPLPIEKVVKGINTFSLAQLKGELAAEAILTTDLVKKTAYRSIEIQGASVNIAGITKGSGMISPNMATTLGFIVTDLKLSSNQCQQVLKYAINESYNMLSVDTDQSTNDMVSLQSSGAIDLALSDIDLHAFQNALTDVCIDLAKQIARDGEGASHFIEVNVHGAYTKADAKRVAKLVVDSPLVKTAIAGEDPNWGRIIMAVGKDPNVRLEHSKLSIQINGHAIFTDGVPLHVKRNDLKKVMSQQDIIISITIGNGDAMATAWGCDLTHGYIDINTEYN